MHGVAALHEQQREEGERATAGYTGGPAGFEVDLDRPEDPKLRVHLGPSLSGVGGPSESVPKADCATVSCVTTTSPARPQPPAPAYTPWGMLAAIDLHDGDRARLTDPDSIRHFVPALIAAIGMRAHGPLMIDRFGDDELEGWSALQFIETSSITVHADEVFGRCFVDVFSCRPFDPELAAALAVAHFGGTATVRVLRR